MDGTKETIRFLGVVLMMLFVGMAACPGFAVVYIPGDETYGTWDSIERVYTLDKNIEDNVEINESNLILDGAGFSVTNPGVGTGVGVYLEGEIDVTTGVTISNLTITGFPAKGVHLVNCSECILAQNIITQNTSYGVYLETSNGNELIGNTVTENSYGIYLYTSSGNNIEGNTVNSNTSDGIKFTTSCDLNTVTDNIVEGNTVNGIHLYLNCDENDITYNTVSNSIRGIELYLGHSNDLTDNLVTLNSTYGILLNKSFTNILTHNVISDNVNANVNARGLYVSNLSNSNQIYNNSFIDNDIQAEATSGTSYNVFYLEPPTGGNYWSDWTGPDDDGDGFVDFPRIEAGTADNYPLVNPYVVPLCRQVTAFYDTCVEEGTIVATTDKINPAEKRLTRFRDILVEARTLIEVGDYTSACEKLGEALETCDGIEPPPDRITGDRVDELVFMILDLMALLGC